MAEFHGHVTAVAQEALGGETTTDLLAGATQIPLDDMVDFYEEGGSALIAGTVYTYSEAVDDSDGDTGLEYITLTSGLLADLPAESRVEVWNASTEAVVTVWHATVTDDNDGSSMTAPLTHTLIAMFSEGMGGLVGESAICRTDEMDEWWVVEVVGATPAYDPGFIRTGGLGADTVVWAGTENGRRAQLDGIDGALECFDDANVQTVNLDGETNFIQGTLATAASGERIELGSGSGGTDPLNEIRFYSESADELEPGFLAVVATEVDPGIDAGVVELRAPDWDVAATRPSLTLTTGTSLPEGSRALLAADTVSLNAAASATQVSLGTGGVGVTGNLNATMGAGSVGTGPFRDSVDARVTAVGGAAYQPLDTDLTAIAALTSAADKVAYATGAGTWALADFTSLARTLAAIATVPNFRTAILAKDKRPGVNTQTANYTIVAADEDVRVQVNSGTAKTVTLPSDTTDPSLPTNFEASVTRLGAGTVTFVADTGVTIDSRGGLLAINGQYGVVNIKKRASNRWIIWGDLA